MCGQEAAVVPDWQGACCPGVWIDAVQLIQPFYAILVFMCLPICIDLLICMSICFIPSIPSIWSTSSIIVNFFYLCHLSDYVLYLSSLLYHKQHTCLTHLTHLIYIYQFACQSQMICHSAMTCSAHARSSGMWSASVAHDTKSAYWNPIRRTRIEHIANVK